jgi:hypothetical protein
LPSLVYHDATPEQAERLQAHLAGCRECQGEYAALQQVPRLLDLLPAPALSVDLPRLYREAADRQRRRLRLWRRAALAAAAAVLLALGLRLDVRVEAHQLSFRWGSPPAVVEIVPSPAPGVPVPATNVAKGEPGPDVEDQLRIVSELVQMLARDLDQRDRQQQHELAALRNHLLKLQRLADERWTATERDIAGTYTLLTTLTKKE